MQTSSVKVRDRSRRLPNIRKTHTRMTISTTASMMGLMTSLMTTHQQRANTISKSTHLRSKVIKHLFNKLLRRKLMLRDWRIRISFRQHAWPGLRTVHVLELGMAKSITLPGASIKVLCQFGTFSVMITTRRSQPLPLKSLTA